MALPFLALIFVFSYLPLYGWIYAFFDFRPGFRLADCEFRGLFFFRLMVSDPVSRGEVIRVLTNTFAISGLNLSIQVLPLFFAVFLVEIRSSRLRRTVQSLTTMPNFLSWPLVFAFAYSMLSVDDGFINRLLVQVGALGNPVNFLASSDHVWLTQTGYLVWKTLGWTAIIYLAAISSIDSELYEAAEIDGADRFRIMRHITIPHLLPTFFVLVLLSIANFLNNGMEQYFVFQNALNKDRIEVLDLYVYNIGIRSGMMGYNYSFATAVGVLKSLVSVVLLFVANWGSKRIRGVSIL